MDARFYSMFIIMVTLTGGYGQDDTCRDVLPDCSEYTKSACKPPYDAWGRKNCAAFCGFCNPPCVDLEPDCADYEQSACDPPYDTWARKHCAKHCGYCGPTTSRTTPPTTPAVVKTNCVYRGKDYQFGEVWQDGCTYNCTCGAGNAYRCSTICATFTNPPANCHYQAIDGECCRKLICSSGSNVPVLSDTGCLYNRKKYDQGESWMDGCSINCTCVDGRTGQYQCRDACPEVKAAAGCVIVKRAGSCCPESVCNQTTSSSGQVGGCSYNGFLYGEGDEWIEGCSLKHTCKNATTGSSIAQPRCLNLLLPRICHLDPPPTGKCCEVPNCPASYTYNYPPGYVPQ
ncbi:kielin/chordin-like protein [Ostrea edulis]|uniref:kielin/chordin-like protein n=1 Tax=Ostrea edulis TaxID=37623 RepID=UPI0024AF06D2|nr:kielin/chordin-like protein [Ostrea edulis]